MTDILNKEQISAVGATGNVLVTACPGSGKTRVLTQRILRALGEMTSTKRRVVGLTFTNRAADEVKSRLDEHLVDLSALWAGTIHSFCLEWIVRPYCCYSDKLRKGFTLADEHYSAQKIAALKKLYGVKSEETILTRLDRAGRFIYKGGVASQICHDYHEHLFQNKLIDYDLVLFLAYRLLCENVEIPLTLSSIIEVFCVDEFQDTQDLQYGVLAEIVRASKGATTMFIVGDPDQAIYASLGGIAKSKEELEEEFGIDEIEHLTLPGNYRSTQRIIDLYLNFQKESVAIEARTDYASEDGVITFSDQEYDKDDLPEVISQILQESLDLGVQEKEICIVAPHWRHVTKLGRRLVSLLPDVDFDAPGLSPIRHSVENIWYKIARLFLSAPTQNMFITRRRWAGEVIRECEAVMGRKLDEHLESPRRFLRVMNGIQPPEKDGLLFLQCAFDQLEQALGIDVEDYLSLSIQRTVFFEKAAARLADPDFDVPSDVDSLRKMFRRPNGVVINTCHGIKGEEYHTMICFGLLRGYVPNWSVIIHGTDEQEVDEANKLLYVICSRAKQRLHLIAESADESRSERGPRTRPLGRLPVYRSISIEESKLCPLGSLQVNGRNCGEGTAGMWFPDLLTDSSSASSVKSP